MAKKKVVKKAAKPAKPAKAASRVAKTGLRQPRKLWQKRSPFQGNLLRKRHPWLASRWWSSRKPTPPPEPELIQRKKGVRKATISSGIHDEKPSRKLGRSRIPIDAPLDVVFQNDIQAREAFMFLGIHSIRDLEQFNPDDLVLRLDRPGETHGWPNSQNPGDEQSLPFE